MKKHLLLGAFTLLTATAASAQETPAKLPNYAKTPAEIAAIPPTGGPGGSGNAKVTVVNILGDPSKPGPYAQVLQAAPQARIPAHHHAGDRFGTVLKGTWHFGFGATFDEAALKTLPVGSVYTEPSGVAHFAMTGAEPVVVLITGTGPTDTVYENLDDDPTRKAH